MTQVAKMQAISFDVSNKIQEEKFDGSGPMLCYIQPRDDGKPLPYAGHFSQDTTACAPPPWFKPDAAYAAHGISLTNMRNLTEQPQLDVQGFEYAVQPTQFFTDEEKITDPDLLAQYSHELEDFVKEKLGAKKVFVFEPPHFRKRTKAVSYSVPVTEVHIDVSEESARELVEYFFPEQSEKLLANRYQVINLWRPLFDSLSDWPLALCDARSVSSEDLITTLSPYPYGYSHSWQLYHNPNHSWYYLDQQNKDEVLMFKSFDSANDCAKATPHAAVDIARVQGLIDVKKRQSVEARMLVFY